MSVALLTVSAGATLETDVSAIKTDISAMRTVLNNVKSSVDYIESDVDVIRSTLGTVSSNVTTYLPAISSKLTDINSNTSSLSSQLQSIVSRLISIDVNTDYLPTMSGWLNPSTGLLGKAITGMKTDTAAISSNTSSIDSNVSKLTDFFVNVHHKALEDASEDTVDTATSIISSSPNGNTTSNNTAAIGQFSSDVSSAFNTGVSSGQAFSLINRNDNVYGSALPAGRSGSPFAFFSNETLYDLDPKLATRSGSDVEVVDYLSLNRRIFEELNREDGDLR